MFLAQIKKNQPYVSVISSPTIFPPKNMKKKIKETRFELQTQAIHNLSELLCLKTV